jgi:hypothetical protein
VVTTIIAIYGAVLSTVSALLGAWYFLRSGPRLQAEAYVLAWGKLDADALLVLRIWNAGRAEITVNIIDVTEHYQRKESIHIAPLGGSLHGPEVPFRLPGHSGEEWEIELQGVVNLHPSEPIRLSVSLLVGGNRHVNVPVMTEMDKRRLILKPAEDQ